MNTGSALYQVSLQHKALFDIADAAGVRVRCDEGALWITLDNDPRDIVLRAGEVFATDDHRHALVYALKPSTLTLHARGQALREVTRVSFGLRTPGAPAPAPA